MFSQCNEQIVGLCFDESCLQKPEYCFLCKKKGKHINHQDQCKSFSNLNTIIQQNKNMLFTQKEQLLITLQNVSKFLTDMVYQIYQKQLEDCEQLISISRSKNVEQSKIRINLFQYYLNLDVDHLRQLLGKVEEICQKFNVEMKEVMNKFEFPIMNQKSVVESQNSNIQKDAKSIQNSNVDEQRNQNSSQNSFKEDNDPLKKSKIQQANEINDDEDVFQIQMQMIQEEEQNYNIQQSLQLTQQAQQNMENPQTALQMLDKALQLFENNEEAEAFKGRILFKQEKYDLSIKSFEKLIQQNTQIPEIYKLYADCLYYNDRLIEADQFYKRASEINPIDSLSYSNRGTICEIYLKTNVLILLHKYQEAIDCCDKAISLNNESSTAYHNKAQALACLNKFQEALKNYNLAIQYNPNYIISLAKKDQINLMRLLLVQIRLNKSLKKVLTLLNQKSRYQGNKVSWQKLWKQFRVLILSNRTKFVRSKTILQNSFLA